MMYKEQRKNNNWKYLVASSVLLGGLSAWYIRRLRRLWRSGYES